MNRILYVVLLSVLSLVANAQADDYAKRARVKYEQGIKAFESKKYQEAITLFDECDKLSQITYNIGGKSFSSLTSNAHEWKAFIKAQMFLRTTKNKKFDNPRYWAAFIMLDALK